MCIRSLVYIISKNLPVCILQKKKLTFSEIDKTRDKYDIIFLMNDDVANCFIIDSDPNSKVMKYLKPREIKEIPSDLEEKKKQVTQIILQMEEYKNVNKLRDQIHLLYTKSRDYATEHNDKEFKLTQNDLSKILSLSLSQIKNHCRKFKLYEKNKIKSDGRPFSLNPAQIYQFSHWLDSWTIPPRVIEAKTYIYNNFQISIQHTTFKTLLDKLGYTISKVEPMEEKRYTVQFSRIHYHYQILETFTSINQVPSAFFINFDEEGHEPFEDSKSEKVVSPKAQKTPSYYPVPRKGNRSTFLGCITGDGRFIKPIIITKRKTFSEQLLTLGITPENIMLETSQTGYITTEIFNKWLDQAFVPYIQKRRDELNYSGVGVVICDGFSAHITDHFFEVCDKMNLEVFFLPSHSSHITQPLDLGIFAAHKHYSKLPTKSGTSDDEDDDQMTETIVRIFSGWQKAATTASIISSWKQVGAIYEIGGVSFTRIIFSILKVRGLNVSSYPESITDPIAIEDVQKQSFPFNFCVTQVIASMKTNKGKENDDPNKPRNYPIKARIPVKSFNSDEFKMNVAQLKRVSFDEGRSISLTQRLLLCLIPVDHSSKMSEDKLDVNQKGRSKREKDDRRDDREKERSQYQSIPFEEKLELELKSLKLISNEDSLIKRRPTEHQEDKKIESEEENFESRIVRKEPAVAAKKRNKHIPRKLI